ncbi:MAG: 30S ribosome-binding factor RbfA [Defluviitaleaceae bacterium]|nr:30S ribosome-binding factor RbfA [Defluviitaleaceae bacterium]
MPDKNRMIRINDEIKRETAGIIRSELKDPRIREIAHVGVSVVRASATNDLKYCKIYVSVLGDADLKKEVMEGLTNAQGFIRRQLAERINLRNTPEITFVLDESLEHGMRMEKLIDSVVGK